jgi:hypothetical protein
MISKWNIGSMAAIGGLATAVILLTGLPATKADELSEVRGNQLLLQQRIDQLAQPQAPVEAPGTTGSNVTGSTAEPNPPLAGSFPRSFVIPGTSTSIRIGGSVGENLDYRMSR